MTNEVVKKEEVPEVGGVDIVAMRQRYAELKKWGNDKLSERERYQVARVAVAYGLDPFLRHLEVLGGNLYVTVAGLRYSAAKSGELDGVETELLMGDEAKAVRETLNLDSSAVVYRAKVWKKGCSHPFTALGSASTSDVNISGKKPKDIAAMAENRAEARAYRKAFAVGFQAVEEISDINGAGMRPKERPTSIADIVEAKAEVVEPVEAPLEDVAPYRNEAEPGDRDVEKEEIEYQIERYGKLHNLRIENARLKFDMEFKQSLDAIRDANDEFEAKSEGQGDLLTKRGPGRPAKKEG